VAARRGLDAGNEGTQIGRGAARHEGAEEAGGGDGGDDEAEGGEGELAEVLLQSRVGDGDDEVGDGLAVDVVELEVLGDRRARPGGAARGDGGAARVGEAGGGGDPRAAGAGG